MYLELGCHGDFDPFKRILMIIAGSDTGSFIDLCCYDASMTKQLGFGRKVFVDAITPPSVPTEGEFIEASALSDHPIFQQRFDVAFCLDGIEHMHKPQGYELLTRMQSISKKQIIFTPLGEYMVNPFDEHPYSHKCGWLPEDVRDHAVIVCPNWHPSLGIGAFFFFKCPDQEREFHRIETALRADPYFQVR